MASFSWRTGCVCRLHGAREVLEDAHLGPRLTKIATRVVACPKNKKITTTVVRGLDVRAKKKYSLRDSNPRPKTSALNWRLRPLGQNCEVIGGALAVIPDPVVMGRSQTTDPNVVVLGSVLAATFCYFLFSRQIAN